MITGVVRPSREAIVGLRLRGANTVEIDVEAVLDTGFTEYLTLPLALVNSLGLPRVNTDKVILADGNTVGVDLYEGVVIWDAQERAIIVHCMEGSPLIGMSLLYDHLLTMEVVDSGPVSIDAIP